MKTNFITLKEKNPEAKNSALFVECVSGSIYIQVADKIGLIFFLWKRCRLKSKAYVIRRLLGDQ